MKGIITGIVIFLVVAALAFISGCTKECESGEFTSEGKCCTYVCNKACPAGYKKGTCNCECAASTTTTTVANAPTTTTDSNIDDIFDDTNDIDPPVLPV